MLPEAHSLMTDIALLSALSRFHRLSEAALSGTATDVDDAHAALVRHSSLPRSALS